MISIATSVALGEVQTSPKVWQSAWTHVLWEPSSFGEAQAERLPCKGIPRPGRSGRNSKRGALTSSLRGRATFGATTAM